MANFFSRDNFRFFIVVALAVTLALAGWAFVKAETQGDHLSLQNQQIKTQNTHLEALVHQQSLDREDAIVKNVAARKSDCESSNSVRAGLRENVIQGQKQLPLLLKLLPQLNTNQILRINQERVNKQLKNFAPLNCAAYANKALPSVERTKLTLNQQQKELKETEAALHALVAKSAQGRVTTVQQRCELTRLILAVVERQDKSVASSFRHSFVVCEKQLAEVKKIARESVK